MVQPVGVNSGSTDAIWPLKIDVVARDSCAPILISIFAPSCSGCESILSPFLSVIRIRAMSGRVSESTTLTSCRSSRNCGSRGAPLTRTSMAATLLLRADRHQSSRLGSDSELPRRRCIGLSTPLASAIRRHLVASPYAL